MKIAFAGLLLATTSAVPVWAAEFAPASKIDAVTVFLQGADVVRTAELELPAGEHKIRFADLPSNIDPQSIRVEGTGSGGLTIASVDSRNLYAGIDNQEAARKALEKQIASLGAERAALDMAIADSNHQRTFLLSLADKQLTPQAATDTLKGIDVAQLGGLIDLVGQRLGGLAKDIQKAQARQKEIDESVNDLSAKLEQLAPNAGYHTEVVVNVEAGKPVVGTLRVSYRVNEARWVPYYDARLSVGSAGQASALEFVRRAEVVQSTDENWSDVALTLSTARPSGATAAPNLTEQEIGYSVPAAPAQDGAAAPMTSENLALSGELQESDSLSDLEAKRKDADKALRKEDIAQQQAAVQFAGFQANYVIATRVSVDNTGQSKKVRIGSSNHDATLEAVTVPRFDTAAYLTAKFTVKGDGPQMGGAVNLYRDGVFVGQGAVPQLNPGEDAMLGFGVDDLVKVTRSEVKRITGAEGFISSSNVDERAWDITVKNLHAIAMPVKVMDRVPFTALKDIEISEMPGMTAPTERDVDKQRGVLAWRFTLEPEADNVLKTGYKISWPEGVRVGMAE